MNFKIKSGIIISIVLVLGIGTYSIYSSKEKSHIVDKVDRNLNSSDKQVYENKISQSEDKFAEAKNDDEKYNALMQKGFSQHGLGNISDAISTYNDAVKIKPNEPSAYVALYEAQLESGDNSSALENIITAQHLRPADADIWKKYIQIEQDRFYLSNDKLSSLYSLAVNQTNNNIDIITAYASWLEGVGNLQASKEYWQKAIEINPDNKKAYQAEIDRLDKLMKAQ